SMHAHGAMIVDNFEARVPWEVLLQMIVVVERIAKHVVEITVVDIDFIAQPAPVHAFELICDQAENDDHNDKQNSTSADPRGARALVARLLMLDDLDHAPQDQQYWPVTGEQVSQLADRKNMHGAEQKDHADDDQHERPGERSMPRWGR